MANSSSRATVRTAAEIRSAQPKFVAAVLGDAKVTAAYRSERFEFRGRTDAAIQALRLAWRSDAFLAQVCYRSQARLSSLGVPIVPRIAHRLAMLTAQLCIGESVLVHPGVYFAHGQVVIEGVVEIHPGAIVNPWVAIGPRYTEMDETSGATVESSAHVGTDVAPGSTVTGVPARSR